MCVCGLEAHSMVVQLYTSILTESMPVCLYTS